MGTIRGACFVALALLGTACGTPSIESTSSVEGAVAPSAPAPEFTSTSTTTPTSTSTTTSTSTSTATTGSTSTSTVAEQNGGATVGVVEHPDAAVVGRVDTVERDTPPPATAPDEPTPGSDATLPAEIGEQEAAVAVPPAASPEPIPDGAVVIDADSDAVSETPVAAAPSSADGAAIAAGSAPSTAAVGSDVSAPADVTDPADVAGQADVADQADEVGVGRHQVTAPPTEADQDCPSISTDFGGDKLMAVPGHHRSELVEVDLPCGDYLVTLIGRDPSHAPGFQPAQRVEQWVLEAYDAADNLRYRSPPSPDIPTGEQAVTKLLGSVDLTGVTSLRAVHAWPEADDYQSVAPAVRLVPSLPSFPEPQSCHQPNHEARISIISRVRGEGFRLDLRSQKRLDLRAVFPGGSSDRIVALAVAGGVDGPYLGVATRLIDDPDGYPYGFSTYVVPGSYELVFCAKDGEGRHGGTTLPVFVTPPDPDDPVLQPDVVVGDVHLGGAVVEVGADHIVIAGSYLVGRDGPIPYPEVGQVLVVEHTGVGFGFSRRLVAVEDHRRGRRYETVDAELEDVFILDLLMAEDPLP